MRNDSVVPTEIIEAVTKSHIEAVRRNGHLEDKWSVENGINELRAKFLCNDSKRIWSELNSISDGVKPKFNWFAQGIVSICMSRIYDNSLKKDKREIKAQAQKAINLSTNLARTLNNNWRLGISSDIGESSNPKVRKVQLLSEEEYASLRYILWLCSSIDEEQEEELKSQFISQYAKEFPEHKNMNIFRATQALGNESTPFTKMLTNLSDRLSTDMNKGLLNPILKSFDPRATAMSAALNISGMFRSQLGAPKYSISADIVSLVFDLNPHLTEDSLKVASNRQRGRDSNKMSKK